MATDLLSTIRREIDERLKELQPLLAEQQRLLVAAEALAKDPEGDVVGEARPAGIKASGSGAATGSTVKRSRRAAPKAERGSRPASEPEARPKATSERAARGAAREAILGALEHGSHTVSELVVVTAMSAPNINGNLRRLEAEGVVVKAEREGKAAWALRDAA